VGRFLQELHDRIDQVLDPDQRQRLRAHLRHRAARVRQGPSHSETPWRDCVCACR
jgi:hypothetical protein